MMFFKRYGMPLILAVVLYSVVYGLFSLNLPYFNLGLILSVLMSYLIRVCDDISDYEKDLSEGKAILPRKILIVVCCVIVAFVLLLSIIWVKYLMLIGLFIVLIQFAVKDKYRDIIKPLFMPGIVVPLVFSFFSSNFWIYVVVAVLVISDVALLIYKRRRREK